jgi:hypothetical protein
VKFKVLPGEYRLNSLTLMLLVAVSLGTNPLKAVLWILVFLVF